jgi:hypothetical protein
MYFESADPDARELTVRQQNSGRGQFRRSHATFEVRNFICAHIKRDDQVSRRLIQYFSMQSSKLLVLVRDAETGKLLLKPPEEERWLYREKSGLGRASRNDDWHIIRSIGPQFFEEMDKYRQWKFSFKEYYDIYVWDLEAGEPFPALYNCVQQVGQTSNLSLLSTYRSTDAIQSTSCPTNFGRQTSSRRLIRIRRWA